MFSHDLHVFQHSEITRLQSYRWLSKWRSQLQSLTLEDIHSQMSKSRTVVCVSYSLWQMLVCWKKDAFRSQRSCVSPVLVQTTQQLIT